MTTAIAASSINGIHLDLKYLMPRKDYLNEWVKRFPDWGVNTILIEYEDKFPFEKYPFLRDRDAFTPAELKQFLASARGAGLTVIPLVQSLSHLEFALAHPALAHLRDAPEVHTQICPSRPECVDFIRDLYTEVLAYHEPDALFHCGGDEAWFIGSCPVCKARKEKIGAVGIWAEHQNKIVRMVMDAGKRPILWDDIFREDREACGRTGLPKDAILHAWNYGIRSLGEKPTGCEDIEFGGAGGVLKEVEIYRKNGYQSLGGPCFNYGELFPRIAHSIDNTRVWAAKARAADMLGVINTAWAAFHMPVQMTNMLIAASGALCRDPKADVGPGWQARWLEQEFGAPADGLPEALAVLGETVGVKVDPKWGRGFTPIVYCYMNMVFHYPGRQDERRRRGGYPLDWNEVDFVDVYRKGIRASKESPELGKALAEVDGKIAAYPAAIERLKALAARAERRRDLARVMVLFAEMKLTSARAFTHLARGDGDATELRREMERQKKPLEDALKLFYEPVARDRLMRVWWEPAYAVLAEGA